MIDGDNNDTEFFNLHIVSFIWLDTMMLHDLFKRSSGVKHLELNVDHSSLIFGRLQRVLKSIGILHLLLMTTDELSSQCSIQQWFQSSVQLWSEPSSQILNEVWIELKKKIYFYSFELNHIVCLQFACFGLSKETTFFALLLQWIERDLIWSHWIAFMITTHSTWCKLMV